MKKFYKKKVLTSDGLYNIARYEKKSDRDRKLVGKFISERFSRFKDRPNLMKKIVRYFGMIVCPCDFAKIYKNSEQDGRGELYGHTLRSFSKPAMRLLLEDSLYCLLFAEFYDSGDFLKMKEETVLKEDYVSRIDISAQEVYYLARNTLGNVGTEY